MVSAIARGIVAGAAGTAAMTAYQEAIGRLQGRSPLAETLKEPRTWAEAPPSAQLGKKLLDGLFRRRVVTKRHSVAVGSGMHWAYGAGLGAVYALTRSSPRAHPAVHGAAFGAGVWLWASALLPLLKISDPPWKQAPNALAVDLTNHLVYGLGVACVYEALDGR